jgi:hypothetical protein
LRLQRIGMCAAFFFLISVTAGAQTVCSRLLAVRPAMGGFLSAGASEHSTAADSAAEEPVADHPAEEPAASTVDSMATDLMAANSAAAPPAKTKSPNGALLRSLALPGWGQLYNEQYVKSALVLAVEGLLAAGAIVEHQKAEDDHAVYEDPSRSDAVREEAWNRYSRRIDKRNAYLWYYAGFKFLSIIDAYVDAHLYHFDEGPFGVEARAGPEGGGSMAVVVRCDL